MNSIKVSLLLSFVFLFQLGFAQTKATGIINGSGFSENSPIPAGSTQKYTVICNPFLPGYYYSWSVEGGTITAGKVTQTVTVKWNSNVEKGRISVYAHVPNVGITSAVDIKKDVYLDYKKPKFTEYPQSIPFGSTSTYTFSVSSVSEASYNWSIPNGWTLVSGQNTNSIKVKHNSSSLNNSQIAVNISKNGTLLESMTCPYKGITGCDFKISGPDTIYIGSPENYIITGSSPIPNGGIVNWTIGDLYFQSGPGGVGDKVTIARGKAEGERRISAEIVTSYASYTMNKTVIASNSYKPGKPVVPEAAEIRITLESISASLTGVYEDIETYTMYRRKYFYTPTGNLFFKCKINNLKSTSYNLTSGMQVSYSTSTNQYPVFVKNDSFNNFSSIQIPGNGSIYVYIQIAGDWRNYTEKLNGPENIIYNVTRMCFYQGSRKVERTDYNYLFTTSPTTTMSVSPTSVTSDVTVKSDENIALRSIRVVDTMGNTVKIQNYNGNQTEATLNLSDCKKGLYYLKIGNEAETKTVKIIKK